MADKAFREGRVISMIEIAEATGIHRNTLAKIANTPGYNANLENLDKLCAFFDCRLEDLAQFIKD